MADLDLLKSFIDKVIFQYSDGTDNCYEFTLLLEGRNEFATLYTEQPKMAFFMLFGGVPGVFPCAQLVFDDDGLFIESSIAFKQAERIEKLNFMAVLSEYDYSKFKEMHKYYNDEISDDLLHSIKPDLNE